MDLERADCNIELARIRVADSNVKIARAANYIKVRTFCVNNLIIVINYKKNNIFENFYIIILDLSISTHNNTTIITNTTTTKDSGGRIQEESKQPGDGGGVGKGTRGPLWSSEGERRRRG